MAKSKNHTNHNQSRKQHKNKIKKAHKITDMPYKFMCPKYVRNQRKATNGNAKKTRADKPAIDAATKLANAEAVKAALHSAKAVRYARAAKSANRAAPSDIAARAAKRCQSKAGRAVLAANEAARCVSFARKAKTAIEAEAVKARGARANVKAAKLAYIAKETYRRAKKLTSDKPKPAPKK